MPSSDMESLFIYNLQRQQPAVMGWSPSLYEVDQGTRSRFLRHNIDPATITFLHNGVHIQVSVMSMSCLLLSMSCLSISCLSMWCLNKCLVLMNVMFFNAISCSVIPLSCLISSLDKYHVYINVMTINAIFINVLFISLCRVVQNVVTFIGK